jgi:hypothetical protein
MVQQKRVGSNKKTLKNTGTIGSNIFYVVHAEAI